MWTGNWQVDNTIYKSCFICTQNLSFVLVTNNFCCFLLHTHTHTNIHIVNVVCQPLFGYAVLNKSFSSTIFVIFKPMIMVMQMHFLFSVFPNVFGYKKCQINKIVKFSSCSLHQYNWNRNHTITNRTNYYKTSKMKKTLTWWSIISFHK